MKLLLLACLVVCAQANSWNQAPVQLVTKAAAAIVSTGTSSSERSQSSDGSYKFRYSEQNPTGGSSRAESGNGWGAQGSYTLNVADGRQRTVTYVADGAGFRAAISTNEPGTAALPAADTSISSPYAPPQPVQPLPVPVLAAPEPIAVAHAPAPLALAAPIAYAHAPVAIAPVVKAIAPAVSSYSTSINHVAPAPVAIAEPAPLPAPIAIPAPAPLNLKGWNSW